MKKFFVWVALLCMLVGTACSETLPQAACELARRIDVLAGDEVYVSAMFGSNKLVEKVKGFAAGDRDEACTMMVNVDTSGYSTAVMDRLAKELDINDKMVSEEIAKRLTASMLIQIVAAQGSEQLAAVSAITTGTMFATDEEPGGGIYLIFYGEHTPVAVTWSVANGAASLSAMFLPVPELQACTTPQQVADWFASVGAAGVVVTAVE